MPTAHSWDTQGREAVLNGLSLENAIAASLIAKGVEVMTFRAWVKTGQPSDGPYLLTHAPYTTLYGTKGRTEFLLIQGEGLEPIRLEAKWQQVSGSVDEKLPYLFLNAVHQMPEEHIIIVIDGPGWRDGATDWLRSASKNQKEKRIDVFDFEEFLIWSSRNF